MPKLLPIKPMISDLSQNQETAISGTNSNRNPENPGNPGNPVNPRNPGNPGNSENPGNPGNPGISGSQNQEATLLGDSCDSTNVSKLRLVRPWENGKPRKKSEDDSIEDDPETEEIQEETQKIQDKTQEIQEEIQEYVPLKKRRMIMYELDSKYSGVNFQNNSCH
jgi:hypothetical protein